MDSQPPPARHWQGAEACWWFFVETVRNNLVSNQLALLVLVAAAGLLVGCSSSDGVTLFPVEGEIKLNGQPLAGAQVVFHPRQPKDKVPPARAQTDSSGHFKLTTFDTHDGAPAGAYSVTVEYFPLLQQQGEFIAGRNILPPKYASPATTDLKIEVAAGPNKLTRLDIKR